MKCLVQSEYSDPADPHSLLEEPLVVHRRSAEPCSTLIAFIHGLGGSRYGADSTWGRFPSLAFREFPEADIGMYWYRTGLGRLKFWRSIELGTEALVLADIIRDVPYEKLIILGHSMGGLLAKAAIQDLISRDNRAALARIRRLFLMATPQTGSQRVPRYLAWLNKDLRALKPHNPLITSIARTFKNRVAFESEGARADAIVIPTWAVWGASDYWVDQLSAGFQLRDERIKRVRASHRSVVKPREDGSEVFTWVAGQIADILGGDATGPAARPVPKPAKLDDERTQILERAIDPRGWAPGQRAVAFPTAGDVEDPFVRPVGVFASSLAAAYAQEGGRAPYIRRHIDDGLDEALKEGRSVIIVGSPRAGKTRSAWEAARRTCVDYRIAFPSRTCPTPLAALAAVEPAVPVEGGKLVLWLDDAYHLLSTADLSSRTLARLRERYPHLVVIATLESTQMDALRGRKEAVASDANALAALQVLSRVLSEFTELSLNDHLWDRAEAEARQAYPDLANQKGFVQAMGRFFAASEDRWASYVDAFRNRKTVAAIVTAAIDWSRAGIARRISGKELCDMAAPYLARIDSKCELVGQFASGIEAACAASLLVSDNSSDTGVSERGFRAASDLVRTAHEQGTPWGGNVPGTSWDFVLEKMGPNDGIGIALAAVEAGHRERALRAAEFAASSSEGGAASSLIAAGLRMMYEGPSPKVRPYLERAADDDDENIARGATMALVSMCLEEGKLDEGERFLTPYLDSHQPEVKTSAMILAAELALRREQYDRAAAYAKRILEQDLSGANAVSAAGLLVQLAERVDLSHVDALVNPLLESDQVDLRSLAHMIAGLVAFQRGIVDDARDHWSTAKETGAPFVARRSLVLLGFLAVLTLELDEGQHILEPLVDSTDPFVAGLAGCGLGVSLIVRGDWVAARGRLERAADAPAKIRKRVHLLLGVLEAASGNAKKSDAWLAPYEGDDEAVTAFAQASAFSGDLARASELLSEEAAARLPAFDQLLMVQHGAQAAENASQLEVAEWFLEPFVESENPFLASVSRLARAQVALARRQLDRADDLLSGIVAKGPPGLALKAKLLLGASALQRGDFAKAEEWLEPVVADSPEAARASLILGMVALAQGAWPQAREHLERADELAIDEPAVGAQARLQLGNTALLEDDVARAAGYFDTVRESQDPTFKAAAELGLSQVAEKKGDAAAAFGHASAAIELKPDDPFAMARASNLAATLGDRRSALELTARTEPFARTFVLGLVHQYPPGQEDAAPIPKEARHLIRLARGDPESAVRLVRSEATAANAQLLHLDGHVEAAVAEMGRAVEFVPDTTKLIVRGEWLRLSDRLDEALADFDRAAKHDPTCAAAVGNLGKTYRALGRLEEAEANLVRALELDSSLAWVSAELAALKLGRNETDGAAAVLREVADRSDDIVGQLHYLAVQCIKGNRNDELVLWLDLLLLLDPDELLVVLQRGATLSALGRDEEALQAFKRALEIAPGDAQALLARSMHHKTRWELEAALADMERAAAAAPDDAKILATHGEILGLLGRYEECIARLSETLDLDPKCVGALLARGVQHRLVGDLPASVADLDRAVELAPGAALGHRAETALAAGEYQKVVDLLSDAGAADVSDWSRYTRGRAHHAMGDRVEATADFAEAMRLHENAASTPDPMTEFNGAIFRLAAGEAGAAWQRYEALVPRASGELLRMVRNDLGALQQTGPWDEARGSEIVALIEARMDQPSDSFGH